jgi:hypothetical protein
MSALWNRGVAGSGAVIPAAVAVFTIACGGGSSSTPSTPTSPSSPTPTPTSITVYASQDYAVVWSSSAFARANEFEPSFMVNHVGWGYELGENNVVSSIGWGLGFRFDVQSQIAGREISKAVLRLDALWIRPDLSVTPQIRVSAFSSDWTPPLNWNIWAA